MDDAIKKLAYKLQFSLLLILFMLGSLAHASRHKMLNIRNPDNLTTSSCPISKTALSQCQVYHQTTNYTCGAAAVMTVLHYYGKLDTAEMNQQYELNLATDLGAIPGSAGGTTQEALALWFEKHDFNVRAGKNITTDMLINNIDLGIPTIIGFNSHWLVAKGYNRGSSWTYLNADEIVFADSCCGITILSRYQIDATWQDSHAPYHHCDSDNGIYIVATPKKQ